jgi:hypothetical protein
VNTGVEGGGGMQDGRILGRKGQLLSHLNVEHGSTFNSNCMFSFRTAKARYCGVPPGSPLLVNGCASSGG